MLCWQKLLKHPTAFATLHAKRSNTKEHLAKALLKRLLWASFKRTLPEVPPPIILTLQLNFTYH
jgi:hypothetical protein